MPTRRRSPQPKNRSLAVGYLRVSTEEQLLSPDGQRNAIEVWADGHGVEIVAWHLDQMSGAESIEDRPGLLATFKSLESTQSGLLLVARWDRLARNKMVMAMCEHMASQLGVRILNVDGAVTGDGPESDFIRDILQAHATYERGLIRARTIAALRALRRKGLRAGEVPLGYELGPDKKTLLPDMKEQECIEIAKHLHASGYSYRKIAKYLEQEGYEPRGQSWHAMTVKRMVECPDPVEAM